MKARTNCDEVLGHSGTVFLGVECGVTKVKQQHESAYELR